MLETLETGLALFMEYGLPILPYAGVAFITYQVMNRFIKPIVSAHKKKDGSYSNSFWRIVRRGYVFYPMLLGALLSLAHPSLIVGYCVLAGAASQMLYLVLTGALSKYGIKIPRLPRESSIPPKKKKK
jgi:hypothetical protein